MANTAKTIVDKELRDRVFGLLMNEDSEANGFKKINDRQYGIILTDSNGIPRYVRIGAIVAEIREDMSAQELMQSEIATYETKQAEKAEKEEKKKAKIAADTARRAAEKKEGD